MVFGIDNPATKRKSMKYVNIEIGSFVSKPFEKKKELIFRYGNVAIRGYDVVRGLYDAIGVYLPR